MLCVQCGNQNADAAAFCGRCGAPTGAATLSGGPAPMPVQQQGVYPKSRVAYILLGLFLGYLGIHNFYAGYAGRGIAQLLISLFIGWLIVPLVAVFIWIIVEICTVTTDAQGVRFN